MTLMARRQFLALTAAVVAAPLVTEAQPAAKVVRMGILLFTTPTTDPNLPALLGGLRDLGYIEGRNLAIEYRYAEGRPERFRASATALASAKPDIIVVLGGDMVPFAREATKTIPIVMLTSQDPVEAGIVETMARPGGNLTGVAYVSSDTAGKRLQLLKEAMPGLTRLAVLWSPDHADGEYRITVAAAPSVGVRILSLEVRGPDEFDAAFQKVMPWRAEALLVVSSRLMNVNRDRTLEFTSRQRIPLISGWGPWVANGALMGYGPDLNALVRRMPSYVDKIVKGARAADLPIEQPTKFALIVNLKTARALGVTIPPSLLLRADQVIE
jgi:putative ABC transport system substrate-binding protein